MSSSITRLVLAITSVETHETLERWQFDIRSEDPSAKSSSSMSGGSKKKEKEKTEKEVQGEIREIMKQITSSVTFLPILEEPCEWMFELDRVRLMRGRLVHALGVYR
jgi:mitotic spindle assembly checkpoint protein MAD2